MYHTHTFEYLDTIHAYIKTYKTSNRRKCEDTRRHLYANFFTTQIFQPERINMNTSRHTLHKYIQSIQTLHIKNNADNFTQTQANNMTLCIVCFVRGSGLRTPSCRHTPQARTELLDILQSQTTLLQPSAQQP